MGYPSWLLSFIASFGTSRKTTLLLPSGYESAPRPIGDGLPQGSPLSVILFILYNSGLFSIFRRYRVGLSSIGYADDLNALAYSKSTEQNCKLLERAHDEALAWAKRHGIQFEPRKYELIHFTRATRRFNLQATIRLGNGLVKEPTKEVRVLGVWLDSKLTWQPHMRKLVDKAAKQLGALTSITSSTWGPSFARARQIYTSVVRPLITYAAPVWVTETTVRSSGFRKLESIQNKALRTITGGYKATPTRLLEAETFIPPLSLYATQRAHQYSQRAGYQDREAEKAKALSWISKRTRKRRKRVQARLDPPRQEPSPPSLQEAWLTRWASQKKHRLALTSPPSKRSIRLYKGLSKAESSIIFQLRTSQVGLPSFLNWRGVPDYPTPYCSCGYGEGTVRHFLLDCSLYSRPSFFRHTSATELLSNYKLVKNVARWAIQSQALPQFDLAKSLLYDAP